MKIINFISVYPTIELTKEIIEFLNKNSDAITATSAIIITFLAIKGVKEWQLQTKGKTNYEIARRYLKAILKLRDEIKYVRNPLITFSEMETALKESGFESETYKDNMKTNVAVYSRRWKSVRKAWTNLEAELLEVEVSWGIEAVKVSTPLIDSTKKLYWALQSFLNNNHKNDIESIEDLIYDKGNSETPDVFLVIY